MQTTKASLRIKKHIKNENCKCYLGNKEHKARFLAVSQLNVRVGFEHSFFLRAYQERN